MCNRALGTVFSCTWLVLIDQPQFLKSIQAISPVIYSGEANHEGTLEVDDLCK